MSTHLGKTSFLDTPDVNGANVLTTADRVILQVVTGSIPATSGTGTFTLGTTAPTSANGFAIWTQSFTPLSATSKIKIEFTCSVSNTGNGTTVDVWLMAGTTTLAQSLNRISAANAFATAAIVDVYSPGSTATLSFSARAGGSAGTTYVNTGGTNTMGAVATSYTITEYA